MTTFLYDTDSHTREFSATVLACVPTPEGFGLELDRTAFFPGGGGQAADTGELAGLAVLGFRREGEQLLHLVSRPVEPGAEIQGRIDWPERFARMQAHSGEHIVSGIVCNRFGFSNVGFHMGADGMTVDFSGFLDREQLDQVERLANETVWRNVPITVLYPTEEELPALSYRSKKDDLEGPLRLVSIEGADLCACCAPHVRQTGEIGVIRILESIRHKGGVRIRLLCGGDALGDMQTKLRQNAKISALLSAPEDRTAEYVQRLMDGLDEARRELHDFRTRTVLNQVRAAETIRGSRCFFFEEADVPLLREAVNTAVPRCTGAVGAFSPKGNGFQYVVGSARVDMKTLALRLNETLSGRGGGTREMIQGSVQASREEIESFFASL